MKVCNVSLILLYLMHISGDHKYYWLLIGTKWCIVFFIEAACKGFFLIHQHSKEQGQALVSDHSQHCLWFVLHFIVYNCSFYSVSLNLIFVPFEIIRSVKWQTFRTINWIKNVFRLDRKEIFFFLDRHTSLVVLLLCQTIHWRRTML